MVLSLRIGIESIKIKNKFRTYKSIIMYNTKTAVTQEQEFTSAYMPAGINENVTLKEVNVRKSPTDKDFLEFIFEDADGKTASMTEWKNEKNMWIKTDEDLQRRDDLQFGRIMQIINCYYPAIEGSFSTFKEMIDWVKKQLDPMINTKKALRLKVVYDKRNYTQVSSNGIFVEPMTVEDSKIKKFARDTFERQIVADEESKQAAAADSDLPF